MKEIILKVKVHFPCVVFVNQKYMGQYSGDDLYLSIKKQKQFVLSAKPTVCELNNFKLLDNNVEFFFDNDELKSTCNNLKKQEENFYVLNIFANKIKLFQKNLLEDIVHSKSIKISQPSDFVIEINDEIIRQNIEEEINDCKIYTLSEKLIVLCAYSEQKKYYHLFVINTEQSTLVFKEICKEVEINQDELKFLKLNFDAFNSAICYTYVLQEDVLKCVDKYSVYVGDFAKKINSHCIPLAFVECVMSQNFCMAQNLVSDDLKSFVNKNNLQNYFGNIEKCCTMVDNLNVIQVTSKDNQKIDKYVFEIENDIISSFDKI